MKKRINLFFLGFVILGLMLILRLGYWQIVKAGDLGDTAFRQRYTVSPLIAKRGEIKFSDGFTMAGNTYKYFLGIDTREANWPDQSQKWIRMSQEYDLKQKMEIDSQNLKGRYWESEQSRFYPEGSSSAHLVGFLGRDENNLPLGYFGLEGFYNRELSGKNGKFLGEHDAFGHPIILSDYKIVDPQNGRDLTTNIDRTMQYLVYQKLLKGIEKYGAKSGNIVVMEPQTGKILAMVSLPNYDPLKYQNYSSELYRNPVIADAYEPGSTFKVIVMSAALDAGVIDANTVCTICIGPVVIGDYSIKTWNEKYYPNSTMSEVIAHSDNTGMVFVGRKLGKDKLLSYLSKFGFGQKTGIDLQEESQAALRPESAWYEIDTATATFGQGIAVTPIQMVRAVGAIANRGKLVIPRIVEKVGDKQVKASQTEQVISTVAASEMTKIMIDSVNKGDAKWARPKDILIAGKTGTAQVPVQGHYDKDKTIASFVGFAPADAPKFVMLVTLTEPQTSQWGSETAAPLWFDISRELLARYN